MKRRIRRCVGQMSSVSERLKSPAKLGGCKGTDQYDG